MFYSRSNKNCYWTTPEKARSKFSYNQVSLCKRPIGWLGWPVPWYPPQLFRLIKVSLPNIGWIHYFTLMCLVSNKLYIWGVCWTLGCMDSMILPHICLISFWWVLVNIFRAGMQQSFNVWQKPKLKRQRGWFLHLVLQCYFGTSSGALQKHFRKFISQKLI